MYPIPQLDGTEIVKYLRKSRTDDPLMSVEEVLSKHEQRLNDWLTRFQPAAGTIPEANTFREVVSGETLDSRPAMTQLLRLIESPRIKAVLCIEPQRLSRGDYEDIGRLVKILRYTNTVVLTEQYAYDLNDERDRKNFEDELRRGNDYLEYQKRIMGAGRLLAVQNGCFIGNTAPYGYRKTSFKEGKRTIHTLEIVPEEAEVVTRIFEMYSSGCGAVTIAKTLNEEHIPTRTGTLWTQETINPMLSNEHYLGKVRWNRSKTVNKVSDGEIYQTRPKAQEYLIFDGRHPAIIAQQMWDAVQAIRGKIPRKPHIYELSNPLAGLLVCKCGRVMVGRRYTKNGVERSSPRFICQGAAECKSASATVEEIFDEVRRTLINQIRDFEIQIKTGEDKTALLHQQMISRLEKRLETLRAEEVQQWDEKLKGTMPEHVFKRLNDKTVREINEVHSSLVSAQSVQPAPINLQEKISNFKAALAALDDNTLPAKEKNRLLKACIERIEYNREPKEGNPRWTEANPIQLHFTLKI